MLYEIYNSLLPKFGCCIEFSQICLAKLLSVDNERRF